MPGFDVVSSADGAYGCTALQVVAWQTSEQPSRLAPRPGEPERRFRLQRGSGVCFKCSVGGVLAPLDSALSGSPPAAGMFSASLAEGAAQPFWYPSPPNQSSVIRARFDWIGHYAVAIRMVGGGGIIVPFDVEVF